MRHRNRFGNTGSARGIGHISEVIGFRGGQRRTGLTVDEGIVDLDDTHIESLEPRTQVRRGEHGHRSRVRHHELDALVGMSRVDRKVRRPRLEDGQ
ncbi:Uncharacterised protein [Mycobacteroides abscessus subsp. massiliense]|nr:Uncharacterised protein [Mycobacteroides abscessus subsp. massiliense]